MFFREQVDRHVGNEALPDSLCLVAKISELIFFVALFADGDGRMFRIYV